MTNTLLQRFTTLLVIIVLALAAVGCSTGTATEEPAATGAESAATAVTETTTEDAQTEETAADHDHEAETADEHEHEEAASADMLTLPELAAAELNGEPLRVVATTSIIGDVLAQVGGDAIALNVLMGPGQDPHSYTPAARDLTAVTDAHVIFINGWNLEEGLVGDLESIGESVPVVPISANIAPLAFAEEDHADEEHAEEEAEHHHSGADPHVWFSIHNVEHWVENAVQILSELDPANAATFAANAAAYQESLAELESYAETQLAVIPMEKRFLVTNHDAFGYLARDYGFNVLGTVIPSTSTLAEPSASDLADLIAAMQEHNVCTIFTETTLNDALAQTVAAELDGCDNVQVLKLYTGALGPTGSGADSYISMFRANIDAIVAGLR
ncbi:MAG: zinc ABC transporter substrate-binding protein [Chloroflexi bacterium]|nr:zinc ABC transporter substrate-binding protein [Chloroflexota bacterium]